MKAQRFSTLHAVITASLIAFVVGACISNRNVPDGIGTRGVTGLSGDCIPVEELNFITHLVGYKNALGLFDTVTFESELKSLEALIYYSIYRTAGMYNIPAANNYITQVMSTGEDMEFDLLSGTMSAEEVRSEGSGHRIDPSVANRWHHNYLNKTTYYNRTIASAELPIDSTRAVFYALHEIIPGGIIPWGGDWSTAGMYTYLSKYDDWADVPVEKHEQRSTIVQFTGDDDSDGYPDVVDGQIYNLGDLCPPKCPDGEEITRD